MPIRVVVAFLLALAFSVGIAAAQAPSPKAVDDTRSKLDAAEGTLKQIEAILSKADIKGAELQALRAQVDPILEMLSVIVGKLSPRLEALKAKIEQFGAPPADKAKADAEPPATLEGRRVAQKAFDEATAVYRRAHLLDDEALHLEQVITTRRRAIFAHALFERAPSLVSPSTWQQLADEWPRDVRDMRAMLIDALHYAASSITRLQAILLGLLAALIILLYVPARRISRRLLTRDRDALQVPRLHKALTAIRIVVASAILPIVAVGTIVGALNAFELVDSRVQPVLSAAFDAVVRVSIAIGLARAVLAPNRPAWRLIDLDDDVARRLRGMMVTVVAIDSLLGIIETLNDSVGATLPVAVATRALGTLATVLVAALALVRIERARVLAARADEMAPSAAGATTTQATTIEAPSTDAAEDLKRHWWGLLNILGWAVVLVITGAALSGYVAFAAFGVDQVINVAAILAVLRLLLAVIDDGIPAALSPGAIGGRMMRSGIGMRREAVGQFGVLSSGILRVLLIVAAILLVVAPWGLQSDDLASYFRSALFGFSVGGLRISPATIAVAVILFFLAMLASRGVRNWLETKYLPQTRLGSGLRNSILTSLGYVGFIIAASLALSYVGLSFEKFAIIAGALSVGIGFGLQAIVSNLVCGLIILWERIIQVGDWVQIGEEQGYVRRINVRSTEIETMDRGVLILPNTTLVTGAVKNWVRGGRVGRIKLQVPVHYDADPEQVREILLRCAKEHPRVVASPAPSVSLAGFVELGMRFELFAYVDDVEKGGGARSDIYFAVFKGLKQAGFTMP